MAIEYALNPENLPEHLYKFRALTDPNHKRILTHNELFLASPTHFNDPFDSTIPVRYDEGTREEIVNYWAEHLSITRPRLSPDEREREATKLYESGRFQTPQSIEKLEQITKNQIHKTMGVFSLSSDYENILLWSHYADKHAGFCVEFDARRLYFFCIAYLKYLESRSARGGQAMFFRNVTYTRD